MSVLAYENNDDFVLRLNTTDEQDEIVLAKVRPETTLADTVAAVRERIEQAPRDGQDGLKAGDSLVVPIVEVNVDRTYTELLRKYLMNPRWSGLYLDVAQQTVRFRLGEHGATIQSEACIEEKKDARRPAEFVFDRPFLICLERAGAEEPYLAIWVETEELMERAR